MQDIKFDFNDITLFPDTLSEIESRKECISLYNDGNLPIISSPMYSIIPHNISYTDLSKTLELFKHNRIVPTIPRGITVPLCSKYFTSFSLQEFKEKFLSKKIDNNPHKDKQPYKVLIDMANGHMKSLLDAVIEFRKLYNRDEILLMVGNIANPNTYRELSEAGADYIRIGIGGGFNCLTSTQTSVHYPLASLISSCYEQKKFLSNPAKIVVDGGIRNYSDIIKSLNLGADYVMLGSLISKSYDLPKENYIKVFNKYCKINSSLSNYIFSKTKIPLYRKTEGMSSKSVQKLWGKKLTTSEGNVTYQKVSHTVNSFVNNLNDYLKSAMSYSNCKTLEEFIGNQNFIFITENSFKRINK
jgi:IMP dehydrogenase/GMP reductase